MDVKLLPGYVEAPMATNFLSIITSIERGEKEENVTDG
jgi:hypothetical protein